MKRGLTVLALLGVVAAAAGCSAPGEPPRPGLSGAAAGWNVVIVSVDTLRADRLGAYGYTTRPTSPAIDALFASGVGFARASAPRAATWPSLASVLTGLYPSGHGLINNGYAFADDQVTLPKILQAAGYKTAAFLNNMIQANHQGWDLLNSASGKDDLLNSRAVGWVEEQAGTAPFFLWVHYFGVHAPYNTAGRFAPQAVDMSYQGPVKRGKKALARITGEGTPLSEADLEQLNGIYDSAIMGTDRRVEILLRNLGAVGGMERTLVVFLSDHGEELYEHNDYIFHSCSVYEGVLRVPLAFSAPGLIEPGGMVAQPTELVDVTPTILDLLGIEPPDEVHGVSLVPYLERPERVGTGKPAFTEYGKTNIHTVTSGDWKLIINPENESPACISEYPEYSFPIATAELYDLAEDPGERVNLAERYPEKVAELSALIRERFAGLTERRKTQELTKELKEELRALGYVAN